MAGTNGIQNMKQILHSPISVVHLGVALLAVGLGTTVLFADKGTRLHKRLGYAYVISMLLVNATAFGIYQIWGTFGLIHWGAVASLLATGGGIGVALARRRIPDWQEWHTVLMGGSVTGLYAAFVVESTYRLFPAAYFWWVTLPTAGAVFGLGFYTWYRYKRKLGQVVDNVPKLTNFRIQQRKSFHGSTRPSPLETSQIPRRL